MMEVIQLRFEPDQLAQILSAVCQAGDSDQVKDLIRNLYHLVVVEGRNLKMEIQRMSELTDAMVAAAHVNTDRVNAAIGVINDLVAAVKANLNDPVALQAVLDEINASDAALATAIDNVNPPAPVPAP